MKTISRLTNWHPLIAAALFAMGAAIFIPPQKTGVELELLPPPPPAPFLHAAALGRARIAADWMWLKAVQFIGKPGVGDLGYPGLGRWMERIVDLVPGFESAYMRTSVLISTVPDQVEEAVALLARAEQNLVPARCRRNGMCHDQATTTTPSEELTGCGLCPEMEACNWEIPLWRGFVAYFGQLDPEGAASHFCQARRRGGPPYLAQLATRLRTETKSCDSVRKHLALFLRQNEGQEGNRNENTALLTEEHIIRLLIRCEKSSLQQAEGAYRLQNGRPPSSIDDLVRAGLTSLPFAPPGQCWTIGAHGITLGPCASDSASRTATETAVPLEP